MTDRQFGIAAGRRGGALISASCLVAILAGTNPGVSGELDPLLTLDEAVEIALENNHRLLAAAADVGAAEATIEEARGARMPRLEISEIFSRTTNPTLVFSNLLNQESFDSGDFAIDRLNEPDALNNFNSRLSIRQPVWTGGRIRNGIAAATMAHEAHDAGRERTRQEVVYQVIDAYSAAVLAAAQLDVTREAVETARAHVKLVQELREGGLVVESDVLLAQVRLSEVEELLILAESAVAVGDATVNLALGRDPATPFSLSETLDLDEEHEEPAIERLIDEAKQNRADLQAARIMVDAADRYTKVQRAERLPQIGVTGNVEANSERFFDSYGTNWSIFAGARFTIFDGHSARARVRRADQQRIQAERMGDLLEHSVDLEVRRAFHDLRAARKRREQADKAAALAREAQRIIADRYKEGLTTVVELLEAQTALTRARTRETSARRDVVLAGASLDLATGRL